MELQQPTTNAEAVSITIEQYNSWNNHYYTPKLKASLKSFYDSRVLDAMSKIDSNKDLALTLLIEARAINEVISKLQSPEIVIKQIK